MSTEKQMEEITDNIAISQCTGVAVFKRGISIQLNAMTASKISGDAPTKVYLNEPKDGKVEGELASWGSDNLYPQQRLELIRKDTELAPLFKKKAAFLMGMGVFPARIAGFDDKNAPIFKVDVDTVPEAAAFSNNRKFNRWLREAAIDLAYFGNIFPELILDPKRKQVTRIAHQEATNCRLQVMSESKKQVEYCWINADWTNYKKEYTKRLPVIDSTKTSDVELVRDQKGKFHYIYLSSYPSPGDGYYQMPAHEGYFLSGWYDVGIAIPEAKKYAIKKKIAMSYHIEIDTAYWPATYPDWDKLSPAKKKAIVKKEMEALDKDLSGLENTGVAFTSAMQWVSSANVHRHYWKITAVPSSGEDGEGIIDSRESSMHKYRAVGFDPAVLGLGPGRENAGGGSGSDKWAAIKILLAELWPERQVLLDAVFFAYEYNGWAEKGIFPLIIDHPIFSTETASEKPSDTKQIKQK